MRPLPVAFLALLLVTTTPTSAQEIPSKTVTKEAVADSSDDIPAFSSMAIHGSTTLPSIWPWSTETRFSSPIIESSRSSPRLIPPPPPLTRSRGPPAGSVTTKPTTTVTMITETAIIGTSSEGGTSSLETGTDASPTLLPPLTRTREPVQIPNPYTDTTPFASHGTATATITEVPTFPNGMIPFCTLKTTLFTFCQLYPPITPLNQPASETRDIGMVYATSDSDSQIMTTSIPDSTITTTAKPTTTTQPHFPNKGRQKTMAIPTTTTTSCTTSTIATEIAPEPEPTDSLTSIVPSIQQLILDANPQSSKNLSTTINHIPIPSLIDLMTNVISSFAITSVKEIPDAVQSIVGIFQGVLTQFGVSGAPLDLSVRLVNDGLGILGQGLNAAFGNGSFTGCWFNSYNRGVGE
ncbi:hypothetical protein HDU76_009922 [Blyttiomyces sp. JEL0837]|nr:hypothetical protein HDU76_009922 [Blyttiomyces sp. JEL0837]